MIAYEKPGLVRSTYGKRPLWQWIVIYLVVAAIAYGAIYYFVFAARGYSTPAPSGTAAGVSGGTTAPKPAAY
jgi:flagellar basal body-associated protein FliL